MSEAPAPHTRRVTPLRVVLAAIVLAWAVAMVYRRPLQARYFVLRAEWASDPATRARYALRLRFLGPDGIARLMHSDQADLRDLAVAQLAAINDPRAVSLLRQALSDPDPSVGRKAALVLGYKGDRNAVEPLRRLADERDPASAIQAVEALERISHQSARRALIQLARSAATLPARASAIESLAAVRCKAAIDTLIDLLSDEQSVRVELPGDRLLRDIGPRLRAELARKGIPVTLPAPAPTSTTIADLAAQALRRITGRSFGFSTTQPADRKAALIKMWRKWSAGPHPA